MNTFVQLVDCQLCLCRTDKSSHTFELVILEVHTSGKHAGPLLLYMFWQKKRKKSTHEFRKIHGFKNKNILAANTRKSNTTKSKNTG